MPKIYLPLSDGIYPFSLPPHLFIFVKIPLKKKKIAAFYTSVIVI